jgi:hypothetical protein
MFAFSVSPAMPNGLVAGFICAANARDHQFTIPADVMASLLAAPPPITASTAGIAMGTHSTKRSTAGGLDLGLVWSLLTTTQVVGFQ